MFFVINAGKIFSEYQIYMLKVVFMYVSHHVCCIYMYHSMCGHQVSSIPHVISVHELVTSFSSDLSLQACFLEDNRVRGYSEGVCECEYSVSVNLSFTALEK